MESVLTRTESQAYDFAALGKHEGNSGLEDERPAAYLCFGTLHAPHCATQVFVYLAEELPRLFPEKSPNTSGFLATRTRKIRVLSLLKNPRPRHAKSETHPPQICDRHPGELRSGARNSRADEYNSLLGVSERWQDLVVLVPLDEKDTVPDLSAAGRIQAEPAIERVTVEFRGSGQ